MNYVEWNNLYENTEKITSRLFDAPLFSNFYLIPMAVLSILTKFTLIFFGMKKQDIIGMKIEELIPNTKLYEAPSDR